MPVLAAGQPPRRYGRGEALTDTASVQSLEAERAAAIIAALQQEAADIRAKQQRQAASQTQQLDAERAAKQRLAQELSQAQVGCTDLGGPGGPVLACRPAEVHSSLRCSLQVRIAAPGAGGGVWRCEPRGVPGVQDASTTLQRQLTEQAALLSQQSSQERELAAAAQDAAREAARLNMDLQALEHQHVQEQAPHAPTPSSDPTLLSSAGCALPGHYAGCMSA